jgi:hypothetical protein
MLNLHIYVFVCNAENAASQLFSQKKFYFIMGVLFTNLEPILQQGFTIFVI